MKQNVKTLDKIKTQTRFQFFATRIVTAITERFDRLIYPIFDWYFRTKFGQLHSEIQACGNYYIDVNCIESDDIVYSCGVGANICFDEELHRAFNCDVYMFDPTPIAVNYMDKFKDCSYLKFYPWGVWVEDQKMSFYFKFEEQDEQQNLSVTNLLQTNRHLVFDCYSIPSIMKRLSHQHIDILKMDIEGAAMPVLEKLIESDIRPKQILFELEKGRTSLLEFHLQMNRLLKKIEAQGYKLHFISVLNKRKYNFDFLAVRANQIL